MESAKKARIRLKVYDTLGAFLFSGGIILICFLGSRIGREVIENRIVQQSSYLVIASTPRFSLPQATDLPTLTPLPTLTLTPTPTPLPLPAIRLSIPAINLNTSITELSPTERISWNGDRKFIWEPVAVVAGHYESSGYPGEGHNIVFIGHNNIQGEVFKNIDKLKPGDKVILLTEQRKFRYRVKESAIIPYIGNESNADIKLLSHAAPQNKEMVTLISCWPYTTNSHRIIVIAMPIDQDE